MRGKHVMVLAPRLVWQLGGEWTDTQIEIPPGNWHNVLSGRRIAGGGNLDLSRVLMDFPVGLLVKR
jgi:(1->4)-alpha-D-glucan 1-alpha-D-glucosylmutase